MRARDAAFVVWALFIVCCATYGAATFALGLGLGYDLATIIACAVFVSAVMLFDRR